MKMASSSERAVSAPPSIATHLKRPLSRTTSSSNGSLRIASRTDPKSAPNSVTHFGTMDLISGATLFWSRLSSSPQSSSSSLSNHDALRARQSISAQESRVNCADFTSDRDNTSRFTLTQQTRATSPFSCVTVTQKLLPFRSSITNSSVTPNSLASLDKAYQWMRASKPSSNSNEGSVIEDPLEVLQPSEESPNLEESLQSNVTKRSPIDSIESYSSVEASERHQNQQQNAAQKHAFAGAFAGTFVSVCLHPMDTLKTFLQSRNAHKQPALSFISERGVPGLYRGLVSKIACSAPISGIYTVTYESTKNIISPFIPKDYHSFAHSIAGACASFATSFVFTPSEHVKQQMQVGLHYPNCWIAVKEIIRKGGVLALYSGWRAVLCRNIPHSAIKFCTYEKVKDVMASNTQPNALQTTICGGIAGSMASLFSTPFDVVKTRLQTQMVGSCQYNGVFHALTDIAKYEGLKGLFRGLIPRVVMYMSQGAIFFVSYEYVKGFLL